MLSPKGELLLSELLAGLAPPDRVPLSGWAEANITLPTGSSARPGPLQNWPYMVEILDAMGDPAVERVSIMKSARLGYTKGLMFEIAKVASTDPCPIILLMPTDDDAKDIVRDELEPMIDSNPALKKLIRTGGTGRSNLLRKSLLGGGSIKILSGRAPRKLRRHDAKLLCIDEADGFAITAEGDALKIAEKRTMAYPDRKIIVGSTPTEEEISAIERLWKEGSQGIFKVPCPKCGVFSEIVWENIEWDDDDHDKVAWRCPSCGEFIGERYKPAMIRAGGFEHQRPEIKNHLSFRINALVSMLPNAAWSKLVGEYLEAKRGGPSLMMVFHNTILGKTWRMSINRVDASILASRVEPIGLANGDRETIIPKGVMLITGGADVQDDRIELVLIGWQVAKCPIILGHVVFDGNTLENDVWLEFDAYLKKKWRHPNGWPIGIDACAVDSGGREGRTQKVYDWAYPRLGRRIYAIKGLPNARPVWTKLTKVKGDMRAWGVAVDVVKTDVMDRLALEPFDESGNESDRAFRYSDSLDEDFFDQVTGEVRRLRYLHNRPIIEFVPKREGQPLECLDATVYAVAVKSAPAVRAIDLRERAARVFESTTAKSQAPRGADWASQFNS